MSDVSELLWQAINAHQRYRSALTTGFVEQRVAALEEARRLRQQAERLDPAHQDPAWASRERQYPHQAVMAFYAQQLAKAGR